MSEHEGPGAGRHRVTLGQTEPASFLADTNARSGIQRVPANQQLDAYLAVIHPLRPDLGQSAGRISDYNYTRS
jgi:hypothetical protein